MTKNTIDHWYTVDTIGMLDSPALLFYKDRILNNIRNALRSVKDPSLLRPHVKTNKSADICTMMMREGITKFKCATIAEAEMLGSINAPDVLFAFQPVGPKIERLNALSRRFPSTRFSCLIDNRSSAQIIASAFEAVGLTLDVYIDLNVGQNRTGIVPSDAFGLYESARTLPGMTIVGLHAYDGHITDADHAQRKQQCDAAFTAVFQLQRQIADSSNRLLTVVAGGSPTFSVHAQHGSVECSPGTFALWDWSYKNSYPDEPYDYAALVVTRVISIVDTSTICIDLGHKSVASENPLPRVHFLNAPDALPVRHSEEHMILRVPDVTRYRIGDVLYGAPVHVCPTVSMYECAAVVENKKITEEWKITARDKRISI